MPVYQESLAGIIIPTAQSLKATISQYDSEGRSASPFVNDDGIALFTEQMVKERINFYCENNTEWVSGPKHGEDGDPRKGKFNKTSNMNFTLNIACTKSGSPWLKSAQNLDARSPIAASPVTVLDWPGGPSVYYITRENINHSINRSSWSDTWRFSSEPNYDEVPRSFSQLESVLWLNGTSAWVYYLDSDSQLREVLIDDYRDVIRRDGSIRIQSLTQLYIDVSVPNTMVLYPQNHTQDMLSTAIGEHYCMLDREFVPRGRTPDSPGVRIPSMLSLVRMGQRIP
jgi:hypothetical protein